MKKNSNFDTSNIEQTNQNDDEILDNIHEPIIDVNPELIQPTNIEAIIHVELEIQPDADQPLNLCVRNKPNSLLPDIIDLTTGALDLSNNNN